MTAYGDDDFLIDNPIDCYCINDRSGLQANDDSVDVILSERCPTRTPINWLPVGVEVSICLCVSIRLIWTPWKRWMAPTITEIYPSHVN